MRAKRTPTFLLITLASAVLLAACAATPPAPLTTANGRAVVLGPEPGFDPVTPPRDWFRVPPDSREGFAVADLSGVAALRVDAPVRTLLGRRMETPVLAMPYLRWGWYLNPAVYGGGPGDGLPRGVRLLVGFKGGLPRGAQLLDRMYDSLAGDLPPHDRTIELRFGGPGAPRAEFAAAEFSAVADSGVKRIIREHAYGQAGQWHMENVDLAALYAGFWPRDRIGLVEVVFVAVGGLRHQMPPVEGVAAAPVGYVAEILLSR